MGHCLIRKSNNSGRRESVPPGGEEEKEMKNSRKMKKWGCVMLALMSGLMLPGIVQANSGLSDTTQTIGGESYYVGIKGASGNEVIIDSDLDAEAVGGYAYDSGDVEANSNSVAVRDSTVAYDIYSGYAYSVQGNATANRNSVTVNGGTVGNETEGVNIFGGHADSDSGSAEANRNSVTVDVDIFGSGEDNGKVSISGGYAYSRDGTATANKNSVTISGGTVNTENNKWLYIYGGHADSDSGRAEAKNNTVTISGGRITANSICGGCVTTGKAADNIVNITGGTISGIKIPTGPETNASSGSISGGTASGAGSFVTGNRVNISGETILENFYGMGFIAGGDATGTDSKVTGNSVTVSSGTIESVTIYGGCNDGSGGTVADNNIIISSGTFSFADIEGGLALDTDSIVEGNNVTINGGTITNSVIRGGRVRGTGSTAAGNSVTISGGTVTGEVYGGYVEGNTDSTAAGNSVTLSGTADVSGADLYGSNLSASGTNNNLVINGWSGAVKSLNNFDQLEVRAVAGGQNLTDGSNLRLIKANSITGCEFDGQTVNGIQAGVALTVDGRVSVSEDNTVSVIASDVRVSDQTVIAVESRAASVAAVGRGAEAVADSLDTLRGRGEGLSTFASIIGGRSRYNTGSHADVNGWNGIVGTAWTRELTSGTLSYGAFYENGGGSYDTYNTINGRTYRGDGDTVYNGGGLLLRWETNGGTYTEASLRAGMVKNEVGPSLEFAGNRYGFKTENNYYGGHVGIGRIMERDDGDAWDIYGKYFHMHHEGDTVTIAGDEFAFDSVNSDRLRVGARYLDRKSDRFTGYYGLAYEYEFSGDTGGTANHHAMYTPSLQGSTVIGEIGFRGTPGEDSPWSFEVSLRGYAGKQEGISGAVTAAYSF